MRKIWPHQLLVTVIGGCLFGFLAGTFFELDWKRSITTFVVGFVLLLAALFFAILVGVRPIALLNFFLIAFWIGLAFLANFSSNWRV